MTAVSSDHSRRWWILGPVGTSALAIVLYSSWNRPLLYDEFVYFVAGALSFSEVLSVIQETTTNVNQGVTGAYLLTDWALMQVFGAADWALRLPSLVFGALFIVYSLTFLRHKSVGAYGLTLFPVFLITQELVVHYFGEARTYMPLAAATIGLLTYYSASPQWRTSRSGRATGWSAAIIGVLFHPYIALYWPTVLLFGYWTQHRGSHRDASTVRSIVRWSNPPMVITGVIVFAAIAMATWARGRANAFVDPFNFLPGPLPVEILVQNLYAFRPLAVAAVSAAALIVTAGALLARQPRSTRRETTTALIQPAVLFVVAFVLSLIVSLSSIVADFWIFPRQWIASTALAAIAIFWAGCVLYQHAASISTARGITVAIALSAATVIAAVGVVVHQVTDLRNWNTREPASQPDRADLAQNLARVGALTDAEWMEYAQVNVDQGGHVWPEFRSYYLDTDWSQFVLRD